MRHEWLFWLIIAIPTVPMLVVLVGCWWVTRSDDSYRRILKRGRDDG